MNELTRRISESDCKLIKPLKIIYVGPAHDGTCKARKRALEALGHTVRVINPCDFLDSLPWLLATTEKKLQFGPATYRINRSLLRTAAEEDHDWVWIDKNVFVWPSTIKELIAIGLFLIHHLTDDFMNPNQPLRHYRQAIPMFHVHLSSNVFNVEELKGLGVRHAIQTHLGFDPEFCCPGGQPPLPVEEFKTDVVFVGHWRKHLDEFILPIIDQGVKVALWGQGWEKSPQRKKLTDRAKFRLASDEEYPSILASAKIALCFLSHENRNTSTGRSFEIPAVGTFMLAERTDEHESFYVEGKEVEFFEQPAELLEKIRYYLSNEEERTRIARAGHDRASTSGYTYFDRVVMDINNILPIYEEFLKSDRRSQSVIALKE
ncbi:MAG: glycosyltransferase [Desulfomonile tiedjei]|uniref:Glycosyltransferase n=1 Tax=Desulfomonile tiedjei TaxID=2358 RepID=A0A9D6V0R5_9BACT|nr:glycosyltransferase [Desulfomonile tiedjei]